MLQLYPHQEEGVAFLKEPGPRFLADEMGLGKTVQAIRACDEIGARKVIVVCPASLRQVWHYEFKRWSILEPDVLIRSYSELAISRDRLAELWNYNPDVLILDEAHYLKNPSAKRTRAIYGARMKGGLAKRVKSGRIWLLSGTPMPNHPGELWTHLAALRGEPRGEHEFTKHYCTFRPATWQPGYSVTGVRKRNLPELRDSYRGWLIARKADNVLDLPEIRWADLPLRVEEPEFGEGSEALRRLLSSPNATPDQKIQTALALYKDRMATYARMCGKLKVTPLFNYIQDQGLLADSTQNSQKTIVFTHHRDTADNLRLLMGARATGFIGGASDREKAVAVEEFQNDKTIRVFVGSIKAAGEGLTLTAANRVIFAETTWSPGDLAQAAKRAHRIGQSDPVLVQRAFIPGSIDDLMSGVVARKAEMISATFDWS